jgi:hypothetical protein
MIVRGLSISIFDIDGMIVFFSHMRFVSSGLNNQIQYLCDLQYRNSISM